MNPLVSIVIPIYNQAQFLEETFEAVINSTFKQVEIIIVDDGSTDGSSEVALKLKHKYPEKVSVIIQENSGPAKARNEGIKIARGNYILPLDGDDLISSTYIANAVKVLEENPEVKVVYSEAEKFGDKMGKWILKPFSLRSLSLDNMIFVSAFYRKKDWEIVGGYDERMTWGWEDWEFWINMLKSGGEVVKLPETGFFYRIRKNSRRKSTNKKSKQKTIDLINSKHLDFLALHINGPLQYQRSLSPLINFIKGVFR
ncbi:MAG: glycosyltransferase family A protein [Algoriphagus sp.]|uniref:glycosyltransferase family A protein n=1 Tax=Algoriphagus sp. TaxID=1872435 RepID=UPI002730A14B|nr:glycosyltransferase family A protein [Algoriphagus sp.]MDP2041723.1 glycosyltransferase family A protein [Algoriphagus sp.]MDP3473626.1 glycosyltransferase family A protein [Algoriphagus sp.]